MPDTAAAASLLDSTGTNLIQYVLVLNKKARK
jgi:hypothetical protein